MYIKVSLVILYVLLVTLLLTAYSLCIQADIIIARDVLNVLLMADIKSESTSTELQERIESNKQELDRYLGVYPYDRLFV